MDSAKLAHNQLRLVERLDITPGENGVVCHLSDTLCSKLGKNCYLTLGFYGDTLMVLSENHWDVVVNKFNKMTADPSPAVQGASRLFSYIFANTVKSDLSAGSLFIPELFIEFANMFETTAIDCLADEDGKLFLRASSL